MKNVFFFQIHFCHTHREKVKEEICHTHREKVKEEMCHTHRKKHDIAKVQMTRCLFQVMTPQMRKSKISYLVLIIMK
ncbi:hypothetical protein E2C01_093381 [Portunus trituberculatus]|uniref:Uncharacterized protein n=1 Tax=Portunus trituberculatus TaxID=210409 RepID=A0A5B7JIT6_PORTR|nr:hypothetical protein [Portunus trituberculatus]